MISTYEVTLQLVMILEINYTNSCREMHDFIFGNEVNSCRKMHKYVGIIHQFPIYRIILNNLIFLLLVCIKFPFRLTFPLCIYTNREKYLNFHSFSCLLSFSLIEHSILLKGLFIQILSRMN